MTQPLQTRRFKEALARVQHLFVDTPSVTLTTADTAQMAGLDRQVCRVLLRTLIETGFLEQRVRGIFVRRSVRSPGAGATRCDAPSAPNAARNLRGTAEDDRCSAPIAQRHHQQPLWNHGRRLAVHRQVG
jgi:hypothetical protein